MATAHGTISQICLYYLNLEDFASIRRKQRSQHSGAQSIRKEYPFLHYAAKEWSVRYTFQRGELARGSRNAAGKLC